MVKVTLESGTKTLPNVSIVAMKRNPSTGRIANQEWWTAASFASLNSDLVEEATSKIPYEVYRADSVPKWLRWMFPKPQVIEAEYFNKARFKNLFKTAVEDRLNEDLNRSK